MNKNHDDDDDDDDDDDVDDGGGILIKYAMHAYYLIKVVGFAVILRHFISNMNCIYKYKKNNCLN